MRERDTRGAEPTPSDAPSGIDPEEDKRDKQERRRMLRLAGKYSYIGIEFGVAVVIGYLIGDWLDDKFGTHPWLTLVFIGLGLASAARDLFRLVRRTNLDRIDDINSTPTDER